MSGRRSASPRCTCSGRFHEMASCGRISLYSMRLSSVHSTSTSASSISSRQSRSYGSMQRSERLSPDQRVPPQQQLLPIHSRQHSLGRSAHGHVVVRWRPNSRGRVLPELELPDHLPMLNRAHQVQQHVFGSACACHPDHGEHTSGRSQVSQSR